MIIHFKITGKIRLSFDTVFNIECFSDSVRSGSKDYWGVAQLTCAVLQKQHKCIAHDKSFLWMMFEKMYNGKSTTLNNAIQKQISMFVHSKISLNNTQPFYIRYQQAYFHIII